MAHQIAVVGMLQGSPETVLELFDRYAAFGPTQPIDAYPAETDATLHLLRAEACLELGRRDCLEKSAAVVKLAVAGGKWPGPLETEVFPNALNRASALISGMEDGE
ncbi:MAG: hypothetical protein ACKO2N_22810 [Tabrizicola sp.]